MPARLTETAIAKAIREVAETKKRRDLSDDALEGLWLRLSPGGAKSWALQRRDREGRSRKFKLGDYPAMGIAEAREAARRLRVEVAAGADPVADRKRARAAGRDAKAGIGTLAAVLDIYGRHRGAQLKSWSHSRLRVERVFRDLLPRPVAALTAADLQLAADSYPAAQSAAFAVRTIRPALKWGVHRGYVPAGLAAIHAPAAVTRRKRVLTREELAAILPVLRAAGKPHATLLRFLLLTLARLGEAAGARWGDVDLSAGTWTILETKNGEPHVVPLSRQARALLEAIRPADAKPDGLIFCTGKDTRLGNWDRQAKAIQAASGTSGWHRHDLRRTGATLLGEMGVPPDLIEAALNHVAIRSQLAATYNRSRYRPQVAAALQRLADALDGIEAGTAEAAPRLRGAVELLRGARLPAAARRRTG